MSFRTSLAAALNVSSLNTTPGNSSTCMQSSNTTLTVPGSVFMLPARLLDMSKLIGSPSSARSTDPRNTSTSLTRTPQTPAIIVSDAYSAPVVNFASTLWAAPMGCASPVSRSCIGPGVRILITGRRGSDARGAGMK